MCSTRIQLSTLACEIRGMNVCEYTKVLVAENVIIFWRII
jgi:hypothetical protein